MNSIAAHMISNLTSCARFPGQLNVDIGEVTTNLVPFPKVHFVMSSISPLYTLSDVAAAARTKNIDQTFSSAFSKDNQLCTGNPLQSKYLACALLVRGGIQLSDVNRNISRMMGQLDMVHWNQEGFKVGLCSVPPVKHPYSVLCLSNNCCVRSTFRKMEQRFRTLYDKRRAFVHHYTQYVEESHFSESLEIIRAIQDDYSQLQSAGTLHSISDESEISATQQRQGQYTPRSIYAPVI
uniref:Tubulin/FtsZ 2-layer sandwich domain-containing protein n=1 Tax=Aplanochytrium stocchinoi TaxID=215587 RepID=A0A7S3LRP6_9STRA